MRRYRPRGQLVAKIRLRRRLPPRPRGFPIGWPPTCGEQYLAIGPHEVRALERGGLGLLLGLTRRRQHLLGLRELLAEELEVIASRDLDRGRVVERHGRTPL